MTKWRSLVVAAFTAVSLGVAGSATPVFAAPITGQFSITGSDTYDLTANTISFLPGSTVAAGTATGSFAGLNGTAITWAQGASPVVVNYTALTGLLFTGVSGLTFTLVGNAIA